MEEKVAQSSRFRLKNALLSDKLKKSNYVNQCRSWSVCAMVFSNLIFLYLFLPVCLIAYFFCPGIRAKNAVLILFSLIFYAWGEPVYLLLMIASAAVNWYFGLLIERRRKKDFSDSCAGIGSRLSGGIQIRGLFRGESERGFRRVHPRPADRAAHRHLLLYLSGAFLYGRRLARRCSGAALVRKAPALHLALPAADRRAYRPLFGCRGPDRRPAV